MKTNDTVPTNAHLIIGIKSDTTNMLIVEAIRKHTASVIVLHGLGGSPAGTALHVVQSVLAPALPHVRFLMPAAPVRPISRLGGTSAPAWYDIPAGAGAEAAYEEDIAGMDASAAAIAALVRDEHEARGIEYGRIVLAGVSQGGAMAVYAALRMLAHDGVRVGGVFSAVGYVAGAFNMQAERWPERVSAAAPLPIMLTHGLEDTVILTQWHRMSVAILRTLFGGALRVSQKEYPGLGHAVGEELAVDAVAFVASIVPGDGGAAQKAYDASAVRRAYRTLEEQRRKGRIVRSGGCSLCGV